MVENSLLFHKYLPHENYLDNALCENTAVCLRSLPTVMRVWAISSCFEADIKYYLAN